MLLTVTLGACSMAPYDPGSVEQADFTERSVHFSSGNITVRAAVPGDAEAESLLGIDVYDRGIQPVWVEVRNDNDTPARVVISSIDPKYFPPAEVAWFFRKRFSNEGWLDLEAHLIDLALPRRVGPGETVSGLVFTNLSPGTKSFNLDVYRGSLPPRYEQFTFFLRVPGFVPDYTQVRFEELYGEHERVSVTSEALPSALANFGCCSRNAEGTKRGRPVNLYIVAEPAVLLRTLLRAGWVESSAGATTVDPDSVHYLFGRPADGAFRKPRDGTTDRSELGIWKTPVLVDGKALWAAQVRHAIGRRFPLGERLFGVRLDPDTNEGRNYVLQTFWYAQALEQWGFAPTGQFVSEADPAIGLADDPWFSRDDFNAVMWLSDQPVPMNETRIQEWTPPATVTGPDS